MDMIFISELCIETLIGVYEWEKRVPQKIRLDLEVGLPATHAGRSDELRDTLDYAQIVERVEKLFGSRHFSLLEHAAESVAAMIQADFGAPWVRLSIAKLAPLPNVKRLGVIIERGTRPASISN
jgi:dihydroneopterin aldolase